LPAENGEKRQETPAQSCEEDREGDSLEWCLREYERTLSRTTKSSEVTTDEAEVEEHTVSAEREGNRHLNGELRDLFGDGGKPKQNEDAEREKEAIIENHTQTAEQQQRNGPRSSEHSETSPTEPSHIDHDKENDSSAKQEIKHQEDGNASLRLREDPQAFIESNRELLAKEGIIPESDEAKLGDKTTLKLDKNEGLTIIHENQHYKITIVEQEKIGDLELRRYKTGQGEEFLHIPRENMIVPPYETPWYALPIGITMYLDKEYKHELLEAALDKAGGPKALRKELEENGTQIDRNYPADHLHDRAAGIKADKLIPILRYLGRDLNEPNNHITAMGHSRAVEDPNHPFKLDTIDGARILVARFSDETLYIQSGPIFSYANNDAEQRNRIAESLTNVFGRANILNRELDNAKDARVLTSTEVIGHALMRAGAIPVEIIVQNPDIPTLILQGSKEMKREWLRQAFGDEGWSHAAAVLLSRSIDATHRLSENQRNQLDTLSMEWKRRPCPDERTSEKNKYCKFADLPTDIQKALELERPRLLHSEAKMLREDFGINIREYASELYTREGGYGVKWLLQTDSIEDSRRFRNEIGFPQSRKRGGLARMLRIKGDDNF
jgi:hypothetical protein